MVISKKNKNRCSVKIGKTWTFWSTGRTPGQGLKNGTVPAKLGRMVSLFIDRHVTTEGHKEKQLFFILVGTFSKKFLKNKKIYFEVTYGQVVFKQIKRLIQKKIY